LLFTQAKSIVEKVGTTRTLIAKSMRILFLCSLSAAL
jgi:hypothetical protein